MSEENVMISDGETTKFPFNELECKNGCGAILRAEVEIDINAWTE